MPQHHYTMHSSAQCLFISMGHEGIYCCWLLESSTSDPICDCLLGLGWWWQRFLSAPVGSERSTAYGDEEQVPLEQMYH